ncbi:MAG: hypothetical protein KDA24_27150 [Deltaproteobacteria bacterium]|nr:hypothetical protein [Deltaproteobacteria bacterium]
MGALALGLTVLAAPALALAGPLVGTLKDDKLDESSGLVKSRLHPNTYWSHNDSGGDPVLFAVGPKGEALGRVEVTGASAKDWEDIAMDPQGNLWIHDGGNNKNKRRDLTVWRVPESSALTGSVAADRAVRFHFPEQTEFPPKAKNFDSEAIFWDGDSMMLLTKHRADTRTVLYAFPSGVADAVGAEPSAPSFALQRLGEFDVGGNMDNYGGKVTGADLSPDGARLAVLTYHAIFVFERPPAAPSDGSGAAGDGVAGGPTNWLAGPSHRIALVQPVLQQCEAIAWDGDALLVTNEGRALFRLEAPTAPGCKAFPGPGCT